MLYLLDGSTQMILDGMVINNANHWVDNYLDFDSCSDLVALHFEVLVINDLPLLKSSRSIIFDLYYIIIFSNPIDCSFQNNKDITINWLLLGVNDLLWLKVTLLHQVQDFLDLDNC
jgi:hypothetical protein